MRREKKGAVRVSRRTAVFLAVLLPLAAAGIVFGYASLFLYCEERGIPLFACVLKERAGIYCPGCGGSRALLALLRFDIVSSLRFYPAMLPLTLLLFDLYIRICLTAFSRGKDYVSSFRFSSFYGILSIVLLTFLLRDVLWLGFGVDLLGDLSGASSRAGL